MDVAEPSIFAAVERPHHVDPALVVDFDYLHPEIGPGDTVYTALKRLHDGSDILWTPRNGGHWIATRAEDIRWIQETYSIFSHEVFTIPRGTVRVQLPPLSVDPPLHARYRAVFNPFFTPSRVAEMGDKARQLAVELIERIRPSGRCEFVADFAHVLPVLMFLGIVDLPPERREEFIAWGNAFSRATDQEARDRGLVPIVAYLNEVIDARYANPGSDLLSAIAKWRDNPRFGGEHEVIGMALLIFFGGLDTVANMLSFTAWHLATHPEHRRRLRDDPDVVPRAAEEYLRRHGLSNTGRLIVSDVERKGAAMKAGEMILAPIGLSSLDERKHADPFTIDFDREANFDRGKPSHDTFGNGPHKCVGSPLARAEIRIFLEEWLRLIPDFALEPGHSPTTHLGTVAGVDHLNLIWPA